ncbi:MAG: GHKL domain-containing protein [Lachnospiraceae bacterium]|nr:GHKL domain-containing protein [Lachnospiraceae bacterium]
MNQTWLFGMQSALFLLYSISYTWAVHKFCTDHFTCINKRKYFFLVLFSVLYAASNIIGLSGLLPYPMGLLLPLLWQILFFFWVILLYHGVTAQKVLAAALLLAVRLLLQHFTESFLHILTLILLHTIHIEISPFIEHSIDCLTYCLIFFSTVWGTIRLKTHMTGFLANRLPRWYTMLSVPLIVIILLWDFIYIGASHGILLRGSDHLNLYYNQLFSHVGIFVMALLCMCGMAFYLFGMDRIDIEQRQKEQYRAQVSFYQMLEEQYCSLERLRHDLKNHIIGLQRLIANQEWDKMSDYLHKMADSGDIECADDLTGKSIVDALLYYKKSNFSRLRDSLGSPDFLWECDVHIPPECPIADFDLCVIFGNLLDNALEACQKLPAKADHFIKIHAHMVKKCLLIEITNSAKITPDCQKGIGLRNVKDTLDKYNGTLNIYTDNSTFRISILLPCLPAAYDINRSV